MVTNKKAKVGIFIAYRFLFFSFIIGGSIPFIIYLYIKNESINGLGLFGILFNSLGKAKEVKHLDKRTVKCFFHDPPIATLKNE